MSRRMTLVGVLVWAVVATVAAIALAKCAPPPGRQFDAVLWQDPARIQAGIRLEMADRLLADEALIGLTKSQVVAMLGDPPATGYFRNWDLVYHLGDERSYISIDSEWLVARLGPDGRVVEARIFTD